MTKKLKWDIFCCLLLITTIFIQTTTSDLDRDYIATMNKSDESITSNLFDPNYVNESDLVEPLFTLRAMTNNETPSRMDYLYELQSYLEEIGIAVDVEIVDWSTFVGEIMGNRNYDMLTISMTGGGYDPNSFVNIYTENNLLNMWNYNTTMDYNETLGTGLNEWYIQQGTQIMPPNSMERVQHYWDWQNYMMDEILPVIPTYVKKGYDAAWSNLNGYNMVDGLSQSWGKMSWTGSHIGQNSTSEIVIADDMWIDLNPLTQNDKASMFISNACMDPLIKFDANAEAYPHIISDWTHINDTYVRLSIREDIKWQTDPEGLFSDEYLDVEDVFFTFHAWQTVSNELDALYWLEETQIIDNHTLDIFIDDNSNTPENEPYYGYLEDLMKNALPEHYLNQTQLPDGVTPDITHPSWDTFETDCFGTGLFELDAYISDVETNMTVFTDCWWLNDSITGDLALDWTNRFGDFTGGLDQLRIRNINETLDQLSEFNLGYLDIVDVTDFPDERALYETASDFTVHSKLKNSFNLYGFNLNESRGTPMQSMDPCPYDSTMTIGLAIRKAIAHAIDREDINNVVNSGDSEITDYPIFSTFEKWLNPNIITYEYNVTKAKEFLMYAGFETGLDSDGDGLTDLMEIGTTFTDRFNPDTDADGMSDGWEVNNNLDPLVNDSNDDEDFDGLTNLEEYNLGTNPNAEDSDADGMSDGWEVNNNLNPLVDDSNEDPDGDVLTNIEEYAIGTDPHNSDTDSDTLLDGEEVLGMYHPLNPGANATGYVHTNPLLADSDGDTYNDAVELAANTNPNDANDHPINGVPGVMPVWLWWVIGGGLTIGIIAIIIVFIAISKKKRKPTFEEKVEPLEEEKGKKELSDEERQVREEKIAESIRLEEQKILSEPSLVLPVSKSEISVKFLTDLLKAKSFIIMENNGIPLISINFTKDIDSTLASGFLTAITSFGQEVMYNDQPSKSKFSQMGQEGGIYWIFEGSKVRVALLFEREPSKEFKRPVWQFLKQFENDYQKELKEFTGELYVFESARNLIEEHLFINYLYPMKLNRPKLNEIILHDKNVAKVLDNYLENFDDEATLDIHQLIDRSFRELRTLSFDEILQQIIYYVENSILLPIPIAITDM